MNNKAIVLLSGGLDSILATRLMLEQGIDVLCVNFYVEFAVCGGKSLEGAAAGAARMLGVSLQTIDITAEYLEMFRSPRHGYGANMNPCVDCKILMLKKAKEMLIQTGASFLVTGEVLGERPMSQRKDALNIIEKQAGVRGILLRPLSAKLLEPTLPEKEGVVDREKLLDIKGRSRKPQIELAAKFSIKEYPNPAGGCLLTDPGFTNRVKDLIKRDELNIENLRLLKTGRHFRIDDAKLVVGRDEDENVVLQQIALGTDIVLKFKDIQGPLALLRIDNRRAYLSAPCDVENMLIIKAASVAAYHTKFRNEISIDVNYWFAGGAGDVKTISVKPAEAGEVEKLRI